MPVKLAPHVPRMAPNDGVVDAVKKALGASLIEVRDKVGEIILTVERDAIVDVCRALRDTPGLEYQQLMEIAGVDYPDRPERFDRPLARRRLARARGVRHVRRRVQRQR